MNKLAIPAILVATVMVAGIFAFMPVQQASTVHTSGTITTASDADIDTILAAVDTEVAAILVDTSTTIPASTSGIIVTTVIGDGADELYDGTITYNFDAGIDSARIIALFFCDFDQSGSVSDSGDDIAITPINVFGGDLTDGDGTLVAGTTIEQDTMADNDCVEIIEDGIFVPLVGDGANNIVITLDETDATNDDDDADGASLIAIITGIVDATDVTVTSTTADT